MELSSNWAGCDADLAREVERLSKACLDAYCVNTNLIVEHHNIEEITRTGGYGDRQLYELIQNAADQMLVHHGRCEILLTESALYCANEGTAINADGIVALMSHNLSKKRSDEIGRFGVGFKSLLNVGEHIDFLSNVVSMRFDAQWAKEQVRAVVPSAEEVPVLRLAQPVEAKNLVAEDGELVSMSQWATTVVRVLIRPEVIEGLSKQIREFPQEFVLFAPHVKELVLRDRTEDRARKISLHRLREHDYELIDGEQRSVWRVFHETYAPSEPAREDAGKVIDRSKVPIMWAVPLRGRATRGQLWAFFPTEFDTTLSGVLNSPWKTDDNRLNLLEGRFNEELIQEAARFIVDCIPNLVEAEDPASYLDTLPARGREARNWADDILSSDVYEIAADRPSLPDQTGRLQLPARLLLHPEGIPEDALSAWSHADSRPVNWCHPSVDRNRDRRARAERLMWPLGAVRKKPTASEWLEALVPSANIAASKDALAVAGSLLDAEDSGLQAPRGTMGWRRVIARSRILVTRGGHRIWADASAVYLPSSYPSGDILVVNEELADDPNCARVLERLGIRHADRSAELQTLLKLAVDEPEQAEWVRIWSLIHESAGDVLSILQSYSEDGTLRIRTLAGQFSRLESVLLPGPIVPADGSRDAATTVDMTFHGPDLELLHRLHVSSSPVLKRDCSIEPWYPEYLEHARGQYYSKLQLARQRPDRSLLNTVEHACLGPLDVIQHLSPEGRTLYTRALLGASPTLIPWHMRHRSVQVYPTLEVDSPVLWAVRRFGRLSTSLGPREVTQAVGGRLGQWSSLLPVVDSSDELADVLRLPNALDRVPVDILVEGAARASSVDDDWLVGRFYAAISTIVNSPERLWCRIGSTHDWRTPSEVAVAADEGHAAALVHLSNPMLRVGSNAEAETLIEHWGIRPATDLVQTNVAYVADGVPAPLVDVFPELGPYLGPDSDALLVRCVSLSLETITDAGKLSNDLSFEYRNRTVYFVGSDDQELLRVLSSRLGLGISETTILDLVTQRKADIRNERLRRIRSAPTLEDRLIEAVGGSALRSHLPQTLVAMVREDNPRALAQMAMAVFGVEVLQEFKGELDQQDLAPPTVWAGSERAQIFVEQLGFGPEYAGFAAADRSPLLEVDGPAHLPPPHDYQELSIAEISRVLPPHRPARGLLSLPTGAGKTRVAVEAVVRAFAGGYIEQPALWVAQSDELCEQAVQTWRFIWRAVGPAERLSISRLWSTRQATRANGPQVVVATIDKLDNLYDDQRYDWLRSPSCLVIDEAHRSTETSYTALLRWLGFSARSRGDDPCSLLGLTATPFKGIDASATQTLVDRYHGRRFERPQLDSDAMYAALQDMKVLSQVRHSLLDGVDFRLSDDDLEYLDTFHALPARVEQSIGRNRERNEAILNVIRGFPVDWTCLLFAASVDHAETLAALLTLEGIPSVAVSAQSNPAARRFYIEEFRQRRIRVLTNYGVLSQGFDAPSVNAVIVARPTYSPTTYQQMIGRGLRGPKNGGTEECLIVDVQDNLERYGGKLAFTEFEPLWRDQSGTNADA